MWRRLLALAHPDRAGDHELFIWVEGLHEHVAGDRIELQPRRPAYERERRASEPSERVPYHDAFDRAESFSGLTRAVLRLSERVEEPYASLLALLSDCEEEFSGPLYKQQHQGATYRTLAAIGHAVGMDGSQRARFYRIAEEIPLSQRHASHIIERVVGRAA
jgi:hypothetical protein